ncbi:MULTISPECIES: hypothetical protein [Streptomyces]|uniref:Uncharacterized protein n=1 Tax=Streptomyces chilikensis TaxID=1194079 RepID=A0ABV3ESI0_9ACTN|nr:MULTISPECIES: hypothetical protein [Streptomyces]MDH6223255.1 hypothetical protein [Streptomyces sp. MJP52]
MAEPVSGWIWSHNLLPFLQLLSHYAGYAFDGTDWVTVEAGTEDTDDGRADGWYSYPLAGTRAELEVTLARARGTDVLMVTVTGLPDGELRLRADTLVSAFASV